MSEVPLYGTPSNTLELLNRGMLSSGDTHLSSLLLASLESSDTKVHEPEIRARLGTAAPFCEEVGDLPPATYLGH